MTEIQYKSIPIVLEGKDLCGAAKTGSGKTLAFVIPAIELLAREKWNRQMGTGVIIIAPTRELAIQIKGVASKIAQFHRSIRVGLVMGGASRNAEAQMLKLGCGVIVATPGRLMDHLENTIFRYDKLKILVMDEADHILDIGFEHQMHSILNVIPNTRQTLLFSATLTEKTKDLITMAFHNKPEFVRASGSNKSSAAADNLEQNYVICKQSEKTTHLLTWLRRHKNNKVLIFFSTKKGTMFYEKLFRSIGIKVLALYGAMSQDRRTHTFFQFVEASKGILLATNVASRGLDFPSVHWVVQFDPPINPKEYIHRVGRTSRAGRKGEALTFLQPNELAYLQLLEECDLNLKQMEIKDVDHSALQNKLESVTNNNYQLKKYAIDACKAFVRSYDQRAHLVFDNNGVNRTQAAQSFCLNEYPKNTNREYNTWNGNDNYNQNNNYNNNYNNNNQFGNRSSSGAFNRGRDRGRGRGRNRGRGRGRGGGRGRGRGRGRGSSRGRGRRKW